MKKIKKIVAASLLGMTAVANAYVDDGSFNTKEMIDNTAQNVMACTDYCIVGMELRVYWTLKGPRYYRTLVVEHNMPDLLVMTAPEIEKMPWDLYRNTFSKAISSLANSMAKGITGFTFGGGNSQNSGFGSTQSIIFKETDVIGNPSVFMYELLGSKVPNSWMFDHQRNQPWRPTSLVDKPQLNTGDQHALNSLVNGMQNGMGNMTLGLIQAMGGIAIKAYATVNPKVQIWSNSTKTFVNTFKAGAEISRYACNASIEPLNPYYNSMFDFAQWRGGYPITDPHKSKTILNPLGDDWLKPTINIGFDNAAIESVIGAIPNGWARIHPRSGFVNNPDDYKVGTVTAVRGVSIVSERGGPRISKYAGSGIGKVMWQQVHPNVSQCHYNVTNSINGADNNIARNYAWNGWRRTKCSLKTIGSKVMDIPFPRICMRSVFGGGGIRD